MTAKKKLKVATTSLAGCFGCHMSFLDIDECLFTLLDFNRCILCSLCVRASRDVDGKNIFALSGRGIGTHLIVNAKSGQLGDTDFTLDDKAAQVCPVGVILKKRRGFAVPIGERTYDKAPIADTVTEGK